MLLKEFKRYVALWAEENDCEFDADAGYDGDYHAVNAFIIDKLLAEIEQLKKDVVREHGVECTDAWCGICGVGSV